jgi:hypothetical protein
MALEERTKSHRTQVVWEPQVGPQTALLECAVFEVLYGGARGGGKTDGMLGEFANHAATYKADAIGLMVRRKRTELVETIQRSKQIYRPLGAKYDTQEKMWTFPNGARLRFAYLERDADAENYQGHSYTRLYVEEIGNFPSPTPILKLIATLRSGAGVPCCMRATGNPGGPGHQWVKARYITPAPQGFKIITEEYKNPYTQIMVKRSRVFIPSFVKDNKYLGPDYVANLQMAGSANLVKAWLFGDWNIVEGAFFDRWSDANILRPFAVPEGWARMRSMDWGFAKPFSVGWWAIAGDDAEDYGIPRGAMVRYREWYGMQPGKPDVGLRLTAEEIAQGIKERSMGEKYQRSVIDPAAFTESGGPSIAERMAREKVEFERADNRRLGDRGHLGGWDQLRARIDGDDERPMLYVFSTCVDIIRTLPTLQHDPDRAEDLDTHQEDHAADEARYAAMSRPWIKPLPPPPPPPGRNVREMTVEEMWKLLADRPKKAKI